MNALAAFWKSGRPSTSGRNVEPRHRRVRGVVSHRQQKRRRLGESGSHQFDLVDELVDSAGHLLASAGQAVGALPQLGQARLRATGFVQTHRVTALANVRERAVQLGSPSR